MRNYNLGSVFFHCETFSHTLDKHKLKAFGTGALQEPNRNAISQKEVILNVPPNPVNLVEMLSLRVVSGTIQPVSWLHARADVVASIGVRG
jgi:hypothetical protein